MKAKNSSFRSWVEIDTKALKHNFSLFKKVSYPAKIMAVVKSNAYGHGMVPCARIFDKAGAPWFGLDDLNEALALRKAGIKKPILVLGYTLPSRYAEAARKNISITISSLEQLRKVRGLRAQVSIHLKINTGLNRQGVAPSEIPRALYSLIVANKRIKLEGLYSHFASAENSRDKKFSQKQIAVFKKCSEQFEKAGFHPLKHIAGTAAALLLPESRFDLVRIGIGLYGLWPSEEVKTSLQKPSDFLQKVGRSVVLKPALVWKSVISEIKKVKKGETVGYDRTHRLAHDSKLAVVPVGYWHGYPRALSNVGEVFVRGKRCKVIGIISMDMMVVDVTNVRGVKPGDEVTLIGHGISAEEVAAKAGTINYEIVTRINPLLPRVYF